MASGFTSQGGAEAYAQNRHGPDGARLLDPFLIPLLNKYCDQTEVIDAGCGAGPWSIYAANAGAFEVYGFDSSHSMIMKAIAAVKREPKEVQDIIGLNVADVNDVPASHEYYGTALSINVGCAIPDLDGHFKELARVLEPGGVAIVTAPASLEVPFTTYGDEEEKVASFENDLAKDEGESVLDNVALTHSDILRASIFKDGKTFRVAKQAGDLTLGQSINRKIPGMIVPNFNHPREDYERAVEDAGFEIEDLKSPKLAAKDYNEEVGLGSQYVENNPFDIYLLRK